MYLCNVYTTVYLKKKNQDLRFWGAEYCFLRARYTLTEAGTNIEVGNYRIIGIVYLPCELFPVI